MRSAVSLFLTCIFVFLLSPKTFGLELIEWQIVDTGVSYVIPKKEGESNQEAIENYLEYLASEPELTQFYRVIINTLHSSQSHTKRLSEPNWRARALILANSPKDHSLNPRRIHNYQETYQNAMVEALTFPVGAGGRLVRRDLAKLNKFIYGNFDALNLLGGDDIDTHLYGEEVDGARGINATRDRLEAEIAEYFIKKGLVQGDRAVTAQCRGHQFTCILSGFELIQDIPSEVSSHIPHRRHSHLIYFSDTPENYLKEIFGSNVSGSVNSFHHQSLDPESLDEGLFTATATAADGVIEALQSHNGALFVVQYHPELMEDPIKNRHFQFYGKLYRQKSSLFTCQRNFIN